MIERKRWTGPWLWSASLVVAVLLIATTAWTYQQRDESPKAARIEVAGPEIDPRVDRAYGWHETMDVGTQFTDGLNHLDLSGAATLPLTVVSIRPLMDDGPALRVLGVRVRVIPDMLPKNFTEGWFQRAAGFPPIGPVAAGGVAPEGFQVRPARGDDDVSLEIQVGYEVVATGVSNRTGIEVIYEYGGIRKRFVLPSHLTICAPAKVACKPQT